MTREATHPSLCLLGVVEDVGVGFGLGSSLEVDRDETDAKSSYQTYHAKEKKRVQCRNEFQMQSNSTHFYLLKN